MNWRRVFVLMALFVVVFAHFPVKAQGEEGAYLVVWFKATPQEAQLAWGSIDKMRLGEDPFAGHTFVHSKPIDVDVMYWGKERLRLVLSPQIKALRDVTVIAKGLNLTTLRGVGVVAVVQLRYGVPMKFVAIDPVTIFIPQLNTVLS